MSERDADTVKNLVLNGPNGARTLTRTVFGVWLYWKTWVAATVMVVAMFASLQAVSTYGTTAALPVFIVGYLLGTKEGWYDV